MATSGEEPTISLGSVTITGALPAGANNIGSVNVAALPALPAGANAIGSVSVTSLPALPAGANAIGSVTVTSLPALPAGANAIGSVTVTSLPALPAGSNLIGTIQTVPGATGGLSWYSVISLATNNAANIKASAGQVYAIQVVNINAAPCYLKMYNTAGTPVPGTTAVVGRFTVPGNAAGAGFVLPIPEGLAFATGIGVAITTTSADGTNTAVAAGDVILNVLYK